jgi:acetyltransferase-like isoleucine patch superfamily enzyme
MLRGRLPTPRFDVSAGFYVDLLRRVGWTKTAWYSLRFRRPVIVGRGSRINVRRQGTLELDGGMLMLGMAHGTAQGAALDVYPGGVLRIGGMVHVMRGARLEVQYNARLAIGDRSYVNDGAFVMCRREVTIGEGCAIAWNVVITDSDVHELSVDDVARPRDEPVVIGDACWIGTGATILKGSHLATGAVVAAGALVRGAVGERELVAGVPARTVARGVSWKI